MRGTAVALRDPLPWASFAAVASEAEALGYRAAFLPEVGGRDVFAALTGLAGETTRLLLGTGVVPITARERLRTAMAAATVQERSGGRHVLGLGTGPAVPGALARLAEEVRAIRTLLAGGADTGGERLALVPPDPAPIWIAALGPRAVRLAGAIADGVLLNWCTPERVALACAELREGAEAAGRDPASVTVAVYVRACADEDRAGADAALAAAASLYLAYPAYARQFASMGLGSDPAAIAAGVCLSGETDGMVRRLDAFREAGADLSVVYPVPAGGDAAASVLATVRTLAPAAR